MATIITKNSSTASAVPAAGSLVQGELAVNVTDKKLYTKDSGGTVQKLIGSLGNQEASAVAITGGTESGVAITGGTINNTPIGATTAAAVTGTLITATTGFSGPLTGAVTGNTTGTHTGNVTGDVTGNVTGNITASSGTSTFNDVVVNGGLNMNAGTTATITNLTAPTNSGDAATKGYVDTAISNLIGTAPATLDTLGEIADALNDDANLAATLTASIATKVSKAGDTMTGALAMGSNKITGLGTPTAGTDAATKSYVDTADALQLNLSGGTMTGNIVMGSNKVTSTATPTTDDDLTRKAYVDSILGSATSAATSAAAAATSATNAANSASAASSSASAASASASAAAASYDSFDDRYLGSKSSDPTVDNDGNSLLTGATYWNSSSSRMKAYTGTTWADFYPATNPVEQTDIGTAANEIPLNQYLGKLAYKDVLGLDATLNPAPTIASAATVQPLTPITFVSGTTTINTITVPAEFVGGGQITLIPTGLWSTGTSGNIALATTGVVSKALIMTYDAGTAKWYPSY